MKVNVTPVKVWKSDDNACLFVMTPDVNPATNKRWTYWCKKEDLFPNFKSGTQVTCQVHAHEKTTGKTYEIVGIGDEEVAEEVKAKPQAVFSDKTKTLSFTTAWAKDILLKEMELGLVKEVTLGVMTNLCKRSQFLANFVNGEFVIDKSD